MARWSQIQFLRSPGFATIVLIVLALGVQSAGLWYTLEVVKINKEAGLENHLADLGRSLASQLGPESVSLAELAYQAEGGRVADATLGSGGGDPDALAAYEGSVGVRHPGLRTRLSDLARLTRLRGLAILDEGGRVLLSSSDQDRPLQPFESIELDREQFEAARDGRAAGTPAYTMEARPIKRLYVPVTEGGTVGAALCLTAGRDYLGEIEALGANLRVIGSILASLVLLIGWVVHRLLLRQRAFERAAAHADRLSSLGALAAGFAHEVRNPLEIIGACAEDMERTLARPPIEAREGEIAAETCRDILEEVERLNRLVTQFLQYSKADGGAGESAGLAETLHSAAGMLRHAAEKKGVELAAPDRHGAAAALDGLRVAISDAALRQIVVNLAMNAIQATPKGGRIEITAEGDGRQARLRVRDTGPGVPAEARGRIFEPFFTTRPDGSGLGLAIAHRLAAAAGGSLELEDRSPTGGASFLLTVPRAEGERIQNSESRIQKMEEGRGNSKDGIQNSEFRIQNAGEKWSESKMP